MTETISLVLSQHVRGTSIQDCVDKILAKVDSEPAAS